MNRLFQSWAQQGRAWAGTGLALGMLLLLVGCYTDPNPDRPFVFPGTVPPTAAAASAGTTAPPMTGNHLAEWTAMTNSSTSELRPGENITVTFSDLPPEHTLRPMDIRIGEDGKITLLFSLTFVAAGKTSSQLQHEIRTNYVPKYFKELTVTVKGAELVYFVGGEVRNAGRQMHYGRMTVLRAIDTAGGFNEYAKKTAIQLIRANGEEYLIDGKKAVKKPELDLEVLPNDRIFVPRRKW
jgi:protein involved in polysaccharide export with SLBB domain